MKAVRACGVELKGNEALICLLEKNAGLFTLPDCRQQRISIRNTDDPEQLQAFQNTFRKLLQDYQVDKVAIRARPQKGKFAGGAVGFKLEAAIQLIEGVDVTLLTNTEIKEQLKATPLFIDFEETGLKKFLEPAFNIAFCHLSDKR